MARRTNAHRDPHRRALFKIAQRMSVTERKFRIHGQSRHLQKDRGERGTLQKSNSSHAMPVIKIMVIMKKGKGGLTL